MTKLKKIEYQEAQKLEKLNGKNGLNKLNAFVPGIFNKPGLPGRGNLAPLLFCFVFTAARSADVAVERLRELGKIAAKMQVSGLSS